MFELEAAAQGANFAVQVSSTSVTIFPMLEGRPMNPEEYQALSAEAKTAVDGVRSQLMQRTQDVMSKIRGIEKGTWDQVQDLGRRASRDRVGGIFQRVVDSYQDVTDLKQFLDRLMNYVLDNLTLFKGPEAPQMMAPTGPMPVMGTAALTLNPFLPFEVNVQVDNSSVDRVPIIIEANPTWGNLFGRVERQAIMGTYVSDHAMLKPGALHLANGGYLVINARDELMAPQVWEGLKRVIRNREVHLEDPGEPAGMFIPQVQHPEPIPLDLKVIVTGDEVIYRMFTSMDNEAFWDLFKVKAEFDFQVELTDDNLQAYCSFICRTCAEENLLPFEAAAAAEVIQDLIIEADYWTRKEGYLRVQDEHVRQAVAQKSTV